MDYLNSKSRKMLKSKIVLVLILNTCIVIILILAKSLGWPFDGLLQILAVSRGHIDVPTI